MANRWHSKIQTKVCRVPGDTPMDWFLMKSVNAEYPLRCHKCVKNSSVTSWGGLSYMLCAKLSIRCQNVKKMSKSQTHRLWTRFTKKLNSHNEVHTYWCQFWHQIWRSPKLFENTFYAHFEGLWSPSYELSKLTSMCVNLIMSIYFLWTSSIVHVFDFLTTWHLFDYLTSFWHFATWSTFVVMCWIMCNFLTTAWIFTKNLLDIDIDVFYLNIAWFFHDGLI